jgi:hypothetical protein
MHDFYKSHHGNSKLTAILSIKSGEGREFAIAMMAFVEVMHNQEREKYANADMPKEVEEMFNTMGISLSKE